MKRALLSLILLPVAIAQTTPPGDPLDTLVTDSPFVPASGGARAVAGATGPLELRGIVFDEGAYRFSVFDQGTGEANWVTLGERVQSFLARSFNQERDLLTVEHQGRTVVLALQPAKMASGAAAMNQGPVPLPGAGEPGTRRNNGAIQPGGNASNAAGPVPMPPPGPAANPNPAEAQRLQNLALEIRRRRNTGSQIVLPKNK